MNTLWLTKIMGSLYRTVAHLYDMMISLAGSTSFATIEEFYYRVYVLVGIIMLFRMTVSFLTMLIDPDKVSDKKSGVGNMFSRIIVSLVLLISFPFLFELANKIQNALISPAEGSSLILNIVPRNIETNIFSVVDESESAKYNPTSGNPEVTNGPEDFTCYYTFTSMDIINWDELFSFNFWGKLNLHSFLTVRFTKQASNAAGYFPVLDENDNPTGWYIYISPDRSLVYGIEKYKDFAGAKFEYNSATKFVADPWNVGGAGWIEFLSNKECPSVFENFEMRTDSDGHEVFSAAGETVKFNSAFDEDELHAYGWGTNFANILDRAREAYAASSGANDGWDKMYAQEGKEEEVKAILDNDIVLTSDISNAARNFSVGIARTFVTAYNNPADILSDDEMEEINAKLDRISLSPVADSQIEDLEDDDMASVDHLLGFVTGIVVAVVLVVVCVDVVVRNLKLLLLEVIAPISALSYISPDDKIFPAWLKQFAGTYLSLFITIMSISLGVYFSSLIMDNLPEGSNLFSKLFVILGMITFIKLLPGFVSKIFGINEMAGSFKDSFKIIKAGVGLAAGATIGAAVGAATGFGKGGSASTVAGGFFGGAFRGGLSGRKGKIMTGATTQRNRNLAAKNAALNNAAWGQRMLSRVGLTGMRSRQNDIDVAKKKLSIQEAQQSIASAKMNELGGISKRAEKKIVEDNKIITDSSGKVIAVEAENYQNKKAELENLSRQKILSSDEFYNSDSWKLQAIKDNSDIQKAAYNDYFKQESAKGVSADQIAENWRSDQNLREIHGLAAMDDLETSDLSKYNQLKNNSYTNYLAKNAESRSILEREVEAAKDRAVDEYITLARDLSLDEGGDGEIKTRIANIKQYNAQEQDLVTRYRDQAKPEDRVNLTDVSDATASLYNKDKIKIRGMKGKLANANAEGARNVSQSKHEISQMERDIKEQGIAGADEFSKNIHK